MRCNLDTKARRHASKVELLDLLRCRSRHSHIHFHNKKATQIAENVKTIAIGAAGGYKRSLGGALFY